MNKQWILFCTLECIVIALISLLIGFMIRSGHADFGAVVLLPALASGGIAFGFRRLSRHGRMILGFIGALLGIGLVIWMASSPAWRAEEQLTGVQIDELCCRRIAFLIAGEKQLPFIFDEKDMPPEIHEEARRRVERMSFSEKAALCEALYGQRLNRRFSANGFHGTVIFWSLTALCIGTLLCGLGRPASCRKTDNK